ncbi:MAG: NADH-quinone oxidoreductase subunit M [Calditrichaeota bacterium]|nr:NADH-quinone oxidoreductase subunit M [Calditrichota bacterium]
MIEFIQNHILTTITFLPIFGAIILLFVSREKEEFIRYYTLVLTTLVFLVSLPILLGFQSGTSAFQFQEKVNWIPSLGIHYHLGVDGISLLMVMLTTFLMPIVILSSWTYIQKRVKEYMIVFLMLETGMLGVFLSLDLVLFYVFWEGMLIPMYFIIGVWGGPRRIYAALKFFLYTMFGGVLMLVAIITLYFIHYHATGVYSFDLLDIQSVLLPVRSQFWLFLAFALAFAIKVPMFPFHTWLPDAHVEAPTGGSVILAGVLLKMGTYGFLRFCLTLFPNVSTEFVAFISILAIIGIIYGALVSMVQPDLKKLVAYSSVSHLGYVMLGIFALNIKGLQGGLIQMVNHGLSTGALFLVVGMIYERRHTRLIADFGGLAKQIPIFATFFMIVTLSSIGLPGLNGFVGEFLILLGAFEAHKIFAIFAATGIILGAVYMLWTYHRVNFGPLNKDENKNLKDLNLREIVVLVPIVLVIFWIGLYPNYFLKKTEKSVVDLLKNRQAKQEQVLSLEKQASSRFVLKNTFVK